MISLDFIPFLEQKDEEVKTFQSDIPASQGRRTKEGNSVQSSEGGDPRITRALESNVEHDLNLRPICPATLGSGGLSSTSKTNWTG